MPRKTGETIIFDPEELTNLDIVESLDVTNGLLSDTDDSPAKIVGHERLSITDAVTRFQDVPSNAKSFIGTLETARCRFEQVTDPTSTTGQPFEVGEERRFTLDNILNMGFIRTGGTTGILEGHYWNKEKP